MKEKLYNWLTPLGWRRGTVRALIALTSCFLFTIMIIVDAVVLIVKSDSSNLSFLIVLTFLTGALFSFNQGWYFGQRTFQSKEEPKKEFLGKPEVRTTEFTLDEEEAKEKRESNRGES